MGTAEDGCPCQGWGSFLLAWEFSQSRASVEFSWNVCAKQVLLQKLEYVF